MLETILKEKGFMKDLFDAIPFPIFIVDSDVNILYWNFAANGMLGEEQVLKVDVGFTHGICPDCVSKLSPASAKN
ncbi:MAG: PAS domain-containing protein [bacterium]